MFLLWIDDIRTPPSDKWHWAKTVNEAKIHFIQLGGLNGKPGIVSLDHDAGDYGPDYIDFLLWCECKKYLDGSDFSNISFHIHSANVVGRMNMGRIIEYNHWNYLKEL